MFKKILIANRGEIAVRIARACREMGITSVAVFSDADRAALHVRVADEAYPVGPAPSRESYLRIDKLMDVARRAGCDALHPGYGFLAENPALARACAENQINFIGPSPEAMERLGSKTAARQLAARAGVPMVSGTKDQVDNHESAEKIANTLGYPVLLKAVAGGGGKGMRLVAAESEMAGAWRDASSEAQNAFNDARLYLEKYVERPRHIEIQIFGDGHGHIVYLGERECSVQRRHQKVIEESPSPVMTPELRRAMGEAAVRLAKEAEYTNAGTVEFLVDAARNFYFLEVNTRLQVEHPVTEMVTGLDLVKLQIRVAAGEALPFSQKDVTLSGHAVECRLYAEDPANQFFPSPGKILSLRTPSGPGIRLDDGVYEGFTVSTEYDPMLGKLIAYGQDRAEAVARLDRALEEHSVTGIKTNANLLLSILRHEDFARGEIYTRWLDERLPELLSGQQNQERDAVAEDAAGLATLLQFLRAQKASGPEEATAASKSLWKRQSRREQVERSE
ncbi:MAG TPA: acetyl-CoA carboxylase biotin carboxylase subunit [Candidatus Acidoferrales bacterium]|nr:acetyl-CoA carboxylase biotin carboxylase subunit [Candidatus Acidoferrales bacterium]